MVETQRRFTLSHLLEYLFTLLGLLLFLLDIVLDIQTVVLFYQEKDYAYMAVMIFLLLGSSVLLQVFSWLWYPDSLDKIKTKVEKFAHQHLLIKPCHVLQLGVHLRYAGAIETSTRDFHHHTYSFKEAMYLYQDLQMLRLFETFFESAPQLTLMTSNGDEKKITAPTEAATYTMDSDLTPENIASAQPFTDVSKRSRTMAANFYF